MKLNGNNLVEIVFFSLFQRAQLRVIERHDSTSVPPVMVAMYDAVSLCTIRHDTERYAQRTVKKHIPKTSYTGCVCQPDMPNAKRLNNVSNEHTNLILSNQNMNTGEHSVCKTTIYLFSNE